MSTEQYKKQFIKELFERHGRCMCCGGKKCDHTNQKLPDKINVDTDWLWAWLVKLNII